MACNNYLNTKYYFPAYYIRQEASAKLIFQYSKRSKLVFLAQHFKSYSSLKVGTCFWDTL